jgi:hypothetical protein
MNILKIRFFVLLGSHFSLLSRSHFLLTPFLSDTAFASAVPEGNGNAGDTNSSAGPEGNGHVDIASYSSLGGNRHVGDTASFAAPEGNGHIDVP